MSVTELSGAAAPPRDVFTRSLNAVFAAPTVLRDGVIRDALVAVRHLCGINRINVYTGDAAGQGPLICRWSCNGAGTMPEMATGDMRNVNDQLIAALLGEFGVPLRAGQAIEMDTSDKSQRDLPMQAALEAQGMSAVLALPLMRAGVLTGLCICVTSHTQGGVGQAHRADLQLLANVLGCVFDPLEDGAKPVLFDYSRDLALAQQRDVLSVLAQEVGHDLANLVFIVSNTADILEDAIDKAPLLFWVRQIQTAMIDANAVLDGLRRLAPPLRPFSNNDLHHLIAQTLALLDRGHNGVKLITDTAAIGPQEIRANPSDVLQVITNLILEGQDHNRDHDQSVTLTLLPSGPVTKTQPPLIGDFEEGAVFAWLEVSGTGEDVLSGLSRRLLDPAIPSGDLGLGLSMVAAILKRSRAVLWVELDGIGSPKTTIGWPVV